MTEKRLHEGGPVRIVAIGAGNRTSKYMEYSVLNPDKLKLVGVVEPNRIRREAIARKYGVPAGHCFEEYPDFFLHPVEADAVMICTPDDKHYEPCMMAIEAGYHVLLEKPIAQTLPECHAIARKAKEKGVIVGVCHVLRYHPYFVRIKEIIDSGELGEIITINHSEGVGIDRTTHGFVRGIWSREERTNPMLISKCCHDIDFLLWLTKTKCRKVSSFGSLRWFRQANAPAGSSTRCITCGIEKDCPFSAVDLYYNRRDWISNFDVPPGKTLDQVIMQELETGDYGRCVYHCDNDTVDNQTVSMVMEDDTTLSFSMNVFSVEDNRETHIMLTHGEIHGNERKLKIHRFRDRSEHVIDFSAVCMEPFHGGADLALLEDFLDTVRSGDTTGFRTSIDESLESHRICHEAERSRLSGETVTL